MDLALEATDLPEWSRTYCGYAERFVHPYKLALGGKQLTLKQAPCVSSMHAKEARASADGLCTASTVWDAGIILAAHVVSEATTAAACASEQREPQGGAPHKRCLDLGSGTGIVGLAAASSGAYSHVVLSDLPSVLPLLEENAQANAKALSGTHVVSLALAWDADAALRDAARVHGPFDVITGGDLLYRPAVVGPLLGALRALVCGHTVVILAASLQHSPETLQLFVERAQEAFSVQILDTSADADFYSPEVRLLKLRLRRSSNKKRGSKRPWQGLDSERKP
jgi:predicted nicotinamide N-methyase